MKDDNREPRYGWAPGRYLCRCQQCDAPFSGDKRATQCADCAYSLPWPPSPIPELIGSYPLVLYFKTEADRDEFIETFRLIKPDCRTVNL